MKRLLSWLLVLTMLVACLPMSVIPALAVETDVDTGSDSDLELPFDHLVPGYSADNRLTVEWTWNENNTEATAEVTVPAGKTMYFEYKGDPAYELTIDGVKCEFTPAAGKFDTNKFEITNDGAEAKTYALKVALPVGTYNNPKVIEKLSWYMDTVNQAAGDLEGYYYIYTAPEAGIVTLYISNVPEVEVQAPEYDEDGWETTPAVTEKYEGDIRVTKNGKEQYVLSEDGVDNYGWELQIPVVAGDQLLINTVLAADNKGNAYPAGEYSWMGNFAYPAGSEQNPIVIEWSWDENYATATATVEVEADGTYYVGQAGMILTANGEEIEQDAAGTFVLNAGPYELKLETPVGAQANPEVIEAMPYEDSNSLDADANYNYVWTATEDGTVTLDITDGANITVNKVIEISEDGWPVTEQFELATVEYDDNGDRSWVVAENLVIEVVAGQQLNIQVNGLTDWDTWSAPAVDYTLTASFEAAVKCDHDSIANGGKCEVCGLYKLVIGAQLIMGNNLDLQFAVQTKRLTEGCYVEISREYLDGKENDVQKFVLTADDLKTANYIVTYKGIAAKQMVERMFVTVYDASGNPMSITWIDSIETYAIRMLRKSSIPTQKTLIVDMLKYGAAAQVFFGYAPEVENLATRELTADELALGSELSDLEVNVAQNSTYFTGSQLVIESNIKYMMAFKGLAKGYKVVLSYTPHTKNAAVKTYEFSATGKSLVVTLDEMVVADARQMIDITILDANGNELATFQDSIEEYLARQAAKGSGSAAFEAVMIFSDSAYAYLHRNDK